MVRRLLIIAVFLAALLKGGPAFGEIGFPMEEGQVPFGALTPLLNDVELVLIEGAGEELTRVTILALVKGDADDIMSLVANPAMHKDMSEGVEKIVLLPPEGDVTRFETHIDTPGPNTTVNQRMTSGPGRTLHIQSSGSLSGQYSWRFTPLPGGMTGVEYSLYADLLSMGAMIKWVANRAPSIQTGANAITGLISVTGLRRLLHIHRGLTLPEEATPLPDISAHWTHPGLVEALESFTGLGTLAQVGETETLFITQREESPQALRASMLTPEGHYPLKLVTPVKTYDVVVHQYPVGPSLINEKVLDSDPLVFEWSWDFFPLPGGATLLYLRSNIDISETFITRIAMSLDPSVGPAMRLAASLSPWGRAAP